MFWAGIVVALMTAVILTLIFALGVHRTGPWARWWAFFMIIFLVAWAAGLWLTPAGPVYWDTAWLPILITGILVALFLAAATPPKRPPTKAPSESTPLIPPPGEPARDAGLNAFFWILLASFLIVITLGYVL
jgi:hypothetical protein